MAAPVVESPLAYKRGRGRWQELGLLIVILVMGLGLWVGSGTETVHVKPGFITDPSGTRKMVPGISFERGRFFKAENIVNSIFRDMSWLGVMAIGETVVVIAGGIDISIGSTMCLSAFVTALALLNLRPEASSFEVLCVGISVPIGVGLVCGLINGLLVVGLNMHPFIVTLATLSMFHWGPLKLGELYGASQPFGDQPLPAAFTDHFMGWDLYRKAYDGRYVEILGIMPVLAMLLVLAIGWVYLRYTIWGRETFAVGGNEEAARFSGIRVPWVKVRVYMISGLCAGIAGMMLLGCRKACSTDTGHGYELTVIAASVVGGASLTGGRGTALGAILGMLVLQLIVDGISMLGYVNLGFVHVPVKVADTELIYGVCIILAVMVDQLSLKLQSRRSAVSRAMSK